MSNSILYSTLSEGGAGYNIANENFFRLDNACQLSVKDRDLSTPPGSPTEGDCYYVKATGLSAWAGHDGQIAIWHNSAWIYFTIREGWRIWIDDEDLEVVYNGTLFSGQGGALVGAPERILRPMLPQLTSGFTLISGTAYFLYMGKLARTTTFNKVRVVVKTGGTGAQTAEFGIFSSPAEPSRAGQSITKIVSTGTVGDLTTTGQKTNTSAFAQSVAAGTHVWAGVRTALASTQPQFAMVFGDKDQGRILELAGSGALTGAGPWAGGIITDTAQGLGPDIEITID